jgi:GT2 family glycosyltransferase
MTRAPAVAVIVVNYRTPDLTMRCVDSLLAVRGVDQRIIIIDNASRDGSAALFRARWSSDAAVETNELPANTGYAGGGNAGFARAKAIGARYAFVLNSDTIVDPDCVRLLVADADAHLDAAVVSPRIIMADAGGSERLWFGGGRFSLWTGRPIHVGWRRPPSRGWMARREMTYASGCALLVRLEALPGDLFDATLFSYAEDLDLSLRVRRDGHRIRYVPEALVRHDDGASHRQAAGGDQSLRFYLGTRNLIRVCARHARWYHWPTLATLLAVDVVGRFSAAALRDRDRRGLRAVWRGAWHALVGGRHPIEDLGTDTPPVADPRTPRIETAARIDR